MKQKLLPIALLLIGATIWAQRPQTEHYLDPYNPEFEKGELIVKFKDHVVLNLPKSGIATKTGVTAVDELLQNKSVASVEKVFRTATRLKSRPVVKYPNGEEKQVPALYNIYRIKMDKKADIQKLAEEISEKPDVEYAEPNYLVYSMDVIANNDKTEDNHRDKARLVSEINRDCGNQPDKACLVSTDRGNEKSTTNFTPNDPLYLSGDMWHIDAVGAPAAWDTVTGAGQVIAILDTGVDWDHPDLDDNIWENADEIPNNGIDDDNNGYIDDIRGWDYINNDNDPNDDNSHGTHVAGIAAAEGNNGIGVIGIAFEAEIMCLKVLQSSGTGNSADFADAIDYAAQNGATVINMSLGSYGESLAVKDALEVAYSYSFLVAAAGNDGKCICPECFICGNFFPACYSFILGVQASVQSPGPSGWKAKFSNYDPSGPIEYYNNYEYNYECLSPGVSIYSLFPNGNYNVLSGTSMASPILSGAIALMQEYNPIQSKEEIFAKLIQSSNLDPINIDSALNYILQPDLYFVEYSLLDTCQGCDNDGAPDSGETIDIYLTVKNAGGWADSVWSVIRFAPFEDSTVAIIIDSTINIGNISAYATLSGGFDHFQISIDPTTNNYRDIAFEYEVGCGNSTNTITGQIVLNVQNGSELSGVMDSTLLLTDNKLWLINNSFQIGPNGVLILEAGTKLIINNIPIANYGKIICNGELNNQVILTTDDQSTSIGMFDSKYIFKYGKYELYHTQISGFVFNYLFYDYSTFEASNSTFSNLILYGWFNYGTQAVFSDCSFQNIKNWGYHHMFEGEFEYCNFDNIWQKSLSSGVEPITQADLVSCNFSRIDRHYQTCIFNRAYNNMSHDGNNYLHSDRVYSYKSKQGPGYEYIDNSYFGSLDSSIIEQRMYDFWDDPQLKQTIKTNYQQPSKSAHGCVWKVEIDSIDPQDEVLDPLGAGTYQFDVYFNKCMDITYHPTLSFGVRDPHTQHIVSDNAYWSADSSIWTAFYDIGIETGDGINFIRVSDAVDTAGFEIPVEDNERFTFVIQAAASASIEFFAIPGIGKVELEWPPAETEDALGFNLYRYQFIDSVNTTDSIRINEELITDTLFTDFDVNPNETYYYFYKILGTDMAESDRSKIMSATPFNAATGDANGDLAVNVLDITTIVSYLLNQNPTPFLFDAADVNYDGQINVLDIIGAVQLISGGAPPNKVMIANSEADIHLLDDRIAFNSYGQVSALQFELAGTDLEKVKLFSEVPGFEFAYTVSEGKIIGVLYSFDNKTIPSGYHELLRVDRGEQEISWADAVGGDSQGFYVDIHKHQGEPTTPLTFDLLAAYPNPFSHETTIRYQLPEDADILLDIFDMNGRLMAKLASGAKPSGYHQVVWNGQNLYGEPASDGVFICTLRAVDKSGKESKKEMKIILMR